MKPDRVSRAQVIAFRLRSQNLAQRLPPGSLLAAAGACGVQNTPPGSAALSLHARVAALTPGAVDQALNVEKSLLQAWSLRASPHIFPTADAAVFTLGLLPEDEESMRAFIYGVEAALDKINISAGEVIALAGQGLEEVLGGGAMTKDALGVEISAWVAQRLPASQVTAWQSPSWYAPGQSLGESVVRFALPILALRGLCCHGERSGSQALLMRTHVWLGISTREVDGNAAKAGLLRRYLHAYGPSTAHHFAGWAGVGPAQAARTWTLLERELVPIVFDGQETWLLAEDMQRLKNSSPPAGVRFLPPHDPYLQIRDRSTVIPGRAEQRRVWRRAGGPGVLLVDGEIVAAWRHKKSAKRLNIDLEPLAAISQETRLLVGTEAAGLAPFSNCSSVLVTYGSSL